MSIPPGQEPPKWLVEFMEMCTSKTPQPLQGFCALAPAVLVLGTMFFGILLFMRCQGVGIDGQPLQGKVEDAAAADKKKKPEGKKKK